MVLQQSPAQPKDKLPSTRAAQVSRELEKASQGRASAVETDGEGIRVEAKLASSSSDSSAGAEFLPQGTLLLECDAMSIALDPSLWATRCGICAHDIEPSRASIVCSTCQIVAVCDDCRREESTAVRHARECKALQVFLSLLQRTSNSPEDADADTISSFLPMDLTSHLLTIRLLCSIDGNDKAHNWWERFLCLYASPISDDETYNADLIVAGMKTRLESSDEEKDPCSGGSKAIYDDSKYQSVLSRVLGCSHAVTDLSLPLGSQCLGRALFWHHSFYNHACTPNAFLSCCIPSTVMRKHTTDRATDTVTARVHLIRDVPPGKPITISYIPMSGISRQERQGRLQTSYGFICHCEECSSLTPFIQLPKNADVDAVREVQYSCNARLLSVQEERTEPNHETKTSHDDDNASALTDEIESVLSLVRMTQRGIHNQGIPPCHEVSLEAHRLLAMGLSRLGQYKEAIQHHQEFFKQAVASLMDPVAMATQHLALARDMGATNTFPRQDVEREWDTAMKALTTVIGASHRWVQALSQNRMTNSGKIGPPVSVKRRRLDDEAKGVASSGVE